MESASYESTDNNENSEIPLLPSDLAVIVQGWNDESGMMNSTSSLSAEQIGSILRSNTLLRQDVPFYFFETLIHSEAGSSIVCAPDDETGRTILHHVVANLDRPDLVRLLLESSAQSQGHMAELLAIRDAEGFLPIDILSRRIVMKEERCKYKRGTDHMKGKKEAMALTAQWRCVYLLTSAQAGCLVDKPDEESLTFIVHSCVRVASQDVPLALVMQALRRFPEQAAIADCKGNLPIHVFFSSNTSTPNSTAAAIATDEDDPILPKLLQLTPATALLQRNKEGKIPLELAITRHHHDCVVMRRSSNDPDHQVASSTVTIWQLIQACPESLTTILPLHLLPFALQQLQRQQSFTLTSSSSRFNTMYRVLRSIPDELHCKL